MGSVVSIPKRVSACCSTSKKGRKPPSLASEVSILEKDSKKERVLLSLPIASYDTG
jgi:hypothetical protein